MLKLYADMAVYREHEHQGDFLVFEGDTLKSRIDITDFDAFYVTLSDGTLIYVKVEVDVLLVDIQVVVKGRLSFEYDTSRFRNSDAPEWASEVLIFEGETLNWATLIVNPEHLVQPET